MTLLNKLRNWILAWLGIDARITEATDIFREDNQAAFGKFRAELKAMREDVEMCEKFLNEGEAEAQRQIDAAVSRIAQMELDGPQAIQGLQEQITALGARPLKPKPEDDEPQMLSGHVRFTDRKRNYEASKRVTPMTETGKQIADNVRLIASGARKE